MPIVIKPADGTHLPGAFEVLIKVRSEQTNGVMAIIEETVPPKRLISPHTHQNDVWVYVLAGEVGILVGDDVEVAGPGSWALKPRNVVHAMWNAGSVPARVIEVLTPGGTERWFEELAALAPRDRAAFDDACARHGIHFLADSPWTAELKLRYGLLWSASFRRRLMRKSALLGPETVTGCSWTLPCGCLSRMRSLMWRAMTSSR